ncbi:hypothetical protein SUGI_1093080 [Cryptomeria japonica]|nr:hypothetical protein SUGI_1093080 [Cryptomeria japonica]
MVVYWTPSPTRFSSLRTQVSGEMQRILGALQVSELLDLLTKGNQRFVQGDWKGAIACYSECIDSALKDVLGRALHELKEYSLACSCFRLALEQFPAAKEILPCYEKSKKLNEENQQGKFDLSAYFLNDCKLQDIPELSNYIGPVIIKKSPVHGRGLFVTKDVEIGDTLLVENAIAMSGIYRRPVAFGRKGNPASVLEGFIQDTVEQTATCAMSCPRILRQL